MLTKTIWGNRLISGIEKYCVKQIDGLKNVLPDQVKFMVNWIQYCKLEQLDNFEVGG